MSQSALWHQDSELAPRELLICFDHKNISFDLVQVRSRVNRLEGNIDRVQVKRETRFPELKVRSLESRPGYQTLWFPFGSKYYHQIETMQKNSQPKNHVPTTSIVIPGRQNIAALKESLQEPLGLLIELFPNWNEDDLVAVLAELGGDLETAANRISEGKLFVLF